MTFILKQAFLPSKKQFFKYLLEKYGRRYQYLKQYFSVCFLDCRL